MNPASLFRKPARIVEPADWIGHIPFAFWIVEATKPALIVELGTSSCAGSCSDSGSGNAYFAFCQAVEAERLHTQCRAVDTWWPDEARYNELSTYNQQHYEAFSQLLRCTSDEALQQTKARSIDLLHIAGRHTAESLRHIIDSWLPKMSERGTMLIDNISKLNQDLVAAYPHLAFDHAEGLLVLAVGSQQNAALSEMIAEWATHAGRQQFHALFACAGRALESEYRNKQLDKALHERKYKVSQLESRMKFLDEEATLLRSELFKLTQSPLWPVRKFIQRTGRSITKRIRKIQNKHRSPSLQKSIREHQPELTELPVSDPGASTGVYNDSWNFYGGGESHALSLAAGLQDKGTVWLIADTDFNINDIEHYFSLDLSRCRKLVIGTITTSHTRLFDLFINASHKSNLVSEAKTSLYIVNFPHRHINKKLLTSYVFLFNSEFTKKWALRFWGNTIRGDIIYPVRMLQYKTERTANNKEKIMLSVGRFFSGGHCKNQLEIVRSFKKIIDHHPEASEWKLVLAGSHDISNIDNIMYYHQVVTESKGYPIEVAANISRIELDELFRKAAFYIHAAGLGQSESMHPENHEHFGITVLEATLSGCIPLVYTVGGPAEIVQKLDYGYTYDSKAAMQALMIQMLDRFGNHHEEYLTESANIAERSRVFVVKESAKPIPCTEKAH